MAKPRELVGITQLVGLDDLVRGDAERAVHRRVVVAAARYLPGAARSSGIVVARTGHHFAVAGLGGILGVVGLALGRGAILRGLCAGGGALAFALVFALGFLAAFLLFALRRVLGLAEIDIEILEQPAGRPRIGVLIEDRPVELVEILADAALEPGPPQIDDMPRRGWWPLAGQGLPGQQAHRLGHRAFGTLGNPLEALAAILFVEHRFEIPGDPDHAPGAQRLDPRLLDGVENRPGQWPT